jgi:acetolactate synthase-1/2/3 large subunit
MTRLSGGEAVVGALRAAGVRHVFGIVSIHNLPIYDALGRDGTIEVVGVRHEQAAVHAADGYARATGELGVAITSTGPGAANAVPGLYEASVASSRVLMVTGQVDSGQLGADRGCFHEAERQLEMLGAVSGTAESVRRPQDVAGAVLRVIAAVGSGRPRPGVVEIPIDVQHAVADAEVPAPVPPVRAAPDPALLDRAAALLAGARRPLLWAGGGVVSARAGERLVALAERLSAPVVSTVQGRGSIPEDHPLALGANAQAAPLTAEVVARADVVLAVGTRFEEDETAGWTLPLPAGLVHLDADPHAIRRSFPPAVALVGDARLGLDALLERLGAGAAGAEDGWVEGAQAARRAVEAEGRRLIGPDHEAIMDAIRALLPRSGIVVRDATVPAYMWGDRLLPVYEAGTSLWPTSGAIGPGLPLAIGAAIGTGRPTVLIQGDGGFMLNIGELAAAVQHRARVVVCLFNDAGYGILRMLQDRSCDGRRIGVDLATPDFAAVARAFGLPGARVATAGAFAAELERALAVDGPSLIEVDLAALAPITISAAWSTEDA